MAVLALGLIVTGTAAAATQTATYSDLTASITAPDEVSPDTDFQIDVSGTIVGGSAFSVFAYQILEDADWYYDSNHMVVVNSGTVIDAQGFNWGSSYATSLARNKPAGTYGYTFVFGQRGFGHGYYDVAVDLEVTVAESLYNVGWLPPLGNTINAGSTLPLQFEAYDYDTGSYFEDAGVTAQAQDQADNVVATWSYTGNPNTGVDSNAGFKKYHFNWNTASLSTGTYTITVEFSNGYTLTRTITLI